jgi:hypothetical protein
MPLTGCALTSDYSFGCGNGAGGVKTFWIIESDNVSSIGESSGMVSAITKVAGKKFRKYQLVLETSHTEETITGNRQNGTLFYAQSLTMIINKQQLAVRNELLLMSRTQVKIIVEDNNSTWRLYGYENGLTATGGNVTSGTAWGDRNGYEITFTGNEEELAPFVQESVIATLQT